MAAPSDRTTFPGSLDLWNEVADGNSEVNIIYANHINRGQNALIKVEEHCLYTPASTNGHLIYTQNMIIRLSRTVNSNKLEIRLTVNQRIADDFFAGTPFIKTNGVIVNVINQVKVANRTYRYVEAGIHIPDETKLAATAIAIKRSSKPGFSKNLKWDKKHDIFLNLTIIKP